MLPNLANYYNITIITINIIIINIMIISLRTQNNNNVEIIIWAYVAQISYTCSNALYNTAGYCLPKKKRHTLRFKGG